MATVIAVTSGKGGVGKTNIATNLGLALAARKLRVCLFDADTGLANVNILLGIQSRYTIEQVLNGEKQLLEIVLQGPVGLSVVPAASGVRQCTDLTEAQRAKLVTGLQQLERQFDYILIDTAAGIDSSVLDFVASAQYRIVVITPEPTSLTDAFALLKVSSYRGVRRNIFALVNRVDGYQSSQKVYRRFQGAVKKYLHLDAHYLGYLADDPAVMEAVSHQIPVVVDAPGSAVSCCFFALADIVKRQFVNQKNLPYFSHYWHKLSLHEQVNKRRQVKVVASALAEAEKPFSIAAVLGQLEKRDFPSMPMRELYRALESAFEKKYGQSIKSMDRQIADLLAQGQRGKAAAQELHRKLASAYQRRFDRAIEDPAAALTQRLSADDCSRPEFDAMLHRLDDIYQQRFGMGYFDNGHEVLTRIAHLLRQRDVD